MKMHKKQTNLSFPVQVIKIYKRSTLQVHLSAEILYQYIHMLRVHLEMCCLDLGNTNLKESCRLTCD